MRKTKMNGGFTLIELLAVVAILGILAGVSFVAVQNHQEGVARLEQDAIAKEIFIAAQNHITMARTEGYLGLSGDKFGKKGDATADVEPDIYYIVISNGAVKSGSQEMLDLILPQYAIDEFVRGGNYIIRYQPSSGTVLDVFYATPRSRDARFGYDIVDADYKKFMGFIYDSDGKIIANANSKLIKLSEGGVVGWYGGENPAKMARVVLKAPTIEIENSARLIVRVNDMGNLAEDATKEAKGSTLQLVITGETSKVQAVVTLRNKNDGTDPAGSKNTDDRITQEDNTYSLVLDDITTEGWHFADLSNSGLFDPVKPAFIPGENITVQAQVFSQNVLSNIAYSDEEKTNSLFEKLEGKTASINNIRHLENLDVKISGVGQEIDTAIQTTDLDWEDYTKKINSSAPSSVSIYNAKNEPATAGYYVPISPEMILEYNGESNDISHNVSNLNVDWAGDAGMFGKPKEGSSIKNLALIDSNINASTGNAGALAGTLIDTKVENVIAYNSSNTVEKNKITASTGSAGGLVGSMTGTLKAPEGTTPETSTGSIKKSAAALIVIGSDNAGGLIGKASGITVDACYSGGHTIDKTDAAGNTIGGVYDDTVGNYNVTASESGIAGGLIGAATGMGNIENSYSTCSVSGGTVGGFVGGTVGGFVGTYEGAANTNKISNCYATGLVKGIGTDAKEGAFVCKLTQGTAEKCLYYDIINATIPALGNETPDTIRSALEDEDGKITALDATAQSYDDFVGGQDKWKDTYAFVYDAKLGEYYNVNNTIVYNLPGIKRLIPSGSSTTINDTDFVYVHHGDWPAPEIFVFNEATT